MGDVSYQLGHSSIKITYDVYGHWIPGKFKSEVEGSTAATKRNPRATVQGMPYEFFNVSKVLSGRLSKEPLDMKRITSPGRHRRSDLLEEVACGGAVDRIDPAFGEVAHKLRRMRTVSEGGVFSGMGGSGTNTSSACESTGIGLLEHPSAARIGSRFEDRQQPSVSESLPDRPDRLPHGCRVVRKIVQDQDARRSRPFFPAFSSRPGRS